MVQLVTASGVRNVRSWGFQLQGSQDRGELLEPASLLAAPHDVLVLDFSRDGYETSRYLAEDIEALKARSKSSVILGYLSIGEVHDYRSAWERTWTTTGVATGQPTATVPSWLGPTNPAWPNACKVRYWEEGWQDSLFNQRRSGWLDLIAAEAFDGVLIDNVDSFSFWGSELPGAARRPDDPADARDAARRMIEVIASLTSHIRERYPSFMIWPQNGEMILDALGEPGRLALEDQARRAMFLKSVSAIGVEDVYCPGNAPENNAMQPAAVRIDILKRDFLDNRKPVFSVEYLSNEAMIVAYLARCAGDGFVPYAAPSRNLDRLGAAFAGEVATGATTRSRGAVPGPGGQVSNAQSRSLAAPRSSWYPRRAARPAG